MNDDLFNLNDLSDLNDEVKAELCITTPRSSLKTELLILDLFKMKSVLNIDEIIVGLARKHDVLKTRSYIINLVYILARQKESITKVKGKKGTYELPSNPR